MKRSLRKDEYLRQYVLGTHDPDEQFEERLLTDEKLLERLSIVEDEILQDYLSGALSESEREKFEKRFLATDAGREELQFSKAFNSYFAGLPAAEKRTTLQRSWKRFLPSFLRGDSPILRISFAMAIVIVVCLGKPQSGWPSRMRSSALDSHRAEMTAGNVSTSVAASCVFQPREDQQNNC